MNTASYGLESLLGKTSLGFSKDHVSLEKQNNSYHFFPYSFYYNTSHNSCLRDGPSLVTLHHAQYYLQPSPRQSDSHHLSDKYHLHESIITPCHLRQRRYPYPTLE